jgi:hypothetical protein
MRGIVRTGSFVGRLKFAVSGPKAQAMFKPDLMSMVHAGLPGLTGRPRLRILPETLSRFTVRQTP